MGEAIRLTTGTTVNVRNALVMRASTGVFGGTGASTAAVEHLTVNGADRLAVSGVFANAAALTLRNCLINSLTNTPPSYTGGSDNVLSTANTVSFATQRCGAHYLPSGSTRLGITVTNLLDPAGAAIRTVRVGSDGSTNLLSTSGYDTAGVLRASTNALGGVTTFTWSINGSGELVESSVDPAGATQVVTHYRDGGVRSVTGTGVQNRSVTRTFGAQYMDVGSTLVVDGSAVTETVMDAEGNPGDYVITIRDALGQVRRVDQGKAVLRWKSAQRW